MYFTLSPRAARGKLTLITVVLFITVLTVTYCNFHFPALLHDHEKLYRRKASCSKCFQDFFRNSQVTSVDNCENLFFYTIFPLQCVYMFHYMIIHINLFFTGKL